MYKVKYTVVGIGGDSEAIHLSKSPKKAWSLAEQQAEENWLGNHYLGVSWEMWKGHRLIGKSDCSDD